MYCVIYANVKLSTFFWTIQYNPGGGVEEVLKYLNESKKAVLVAQNALKRIIDTLKLEGA